MRLELFMKALMEQLKDFPETDRKQIQEYFEEMICDGKENGQTEEEILNRLGTPEQAAEKLRIEYGQVVAYDDNGHHHEHHHGNNHNHDHSHHQQQNQNPEPEQPQAEQQAYRPEQDVHLLRVNAQHTAVRIRRAPVDQIEVLYNPNPQVEEFSCQLENGVYTVSHRYFKFMWNPFAGLSKLMQPHGNQILIQIPENMHIGIEVETCNAQVSINGPMQLGYLQLTTSNSTVTLEQITADRAILKTSNGHIHADTVQVGHFQAKTSNGRITLQNVFASEQLRARSSNGKIEFDRTQAREIFLQTSNAPICGVLKGKMQDYAITSHTSNGKNSLPRFMPLDGAPKLDVQTSNGKIDIQFMP